MDPVLFGLMAFVIVGSVVALEMKDLLSSVIAVGVVGLGLSIVFLLLAAPDIAITQVVVEVLVVTVLIRAVSRLQPERPARPRRGVAGMIAGFGLACVALGFVIAALAALPAFGTGHSAVGDWYLRHGPDLTGATNVVTAVLLDFRAYDTLGEATVILTAVVGVVTVLRSRKTRALPRPSPTESAPEPVAHDAAPEREREVVHA